MSNSGILLTAKEIKEKANTSLWKDVISLNPNQVLLHFLDPKEIGALEYMRESVNFPIAPIFDIFRQSPDLLAEMISQIIKTLNVFYICLRINNELSREAVIRYLNNLFDELLNNGSLIFMTRIYICAPASDFIDEKGNVFAALQVLLDRNITGFGIMPVITNSPGSSDIIRNEKFLSVLEDNEHKYIMLMKVITSNSNWDLPEIYELNIPLVFMGLPFFQETHPAQEIKTNEKRPINAIGLLVPKQDHISVWSEPRLIGDVLRKISIGAPKEVLLEKTSLHGVAIGRLKDGYVNLRYFNIEKFE